mgnify:CR=1 FL=1
MMYSNKLAVAIKSAKSKVLREFEDKVYIPFGEEYSVFIKNLNSVRASVSVSIDGQDVGDGKSFIVDANDSIDIQRFIKNGNLNEGNRLKFIERTGSVEQHRGVGIEDGLVRVEFQFERVVNIWNGWEPTIYNDPPRPYGRFHDGSKIGSAGINPMDLTFTTCDTLASNRAFKSSERGVPCSANSSVEEYTCDSIPVNDAGITVPGSVSDQQFNEVAAIPLEAETHVIVLKLLGQTESNKVSTPVTVKTKPKCITCGRTNKATAKFCTNCGTSLTLV